VYSYRGEEKMKQFDKIFWINSKNRSDRFRNMKERLKAQDIQAERFCAIYGGEISWNEPKYKDFSMSHPYGETLNLGEIGCFMSHRAIYEMIKKEGWKKTLILEDDAVFCEGFKEIFDTLYNNLPEYDMLYLGQWNYDKGVIGGDAKALKEKIAQAGKIGLYKAERCWLTHAYAVDNSIIDILLDNTKDLYDSIDRVLSDIQEKQKLKTFAIFPSIVTQDLTASSIRN
jgi:GR25 family glycosyltransferase involved in LPS biosynthesis